MVEGIIQNVAVRMNYKDKTSSRYNRLKHDTPNESILRFADAIDNIQTKTIENITKIITKELIML